MIVKSLFYSAMGVALALPLSSCHGIFEGIYDEPVIENNTGYGFIKIDEVNRTGTIYVNASEYTEWHYVDLKAKTVTTKQYDEPAPENWDFAIHRYDTKTNGGKVCETVYEDLSLLPALSQLPKDNWVSDTWTTNKITIDMSQMMQGTILYAEDYYNPCLSLWLNVDTSSMPPSYTLSGKVYVLKLSDGTHAALRLENFMNDSAVKGYMTVNYIYPIAQ